uniref:Uncharacterized protein n=1 Tax=Strigamia maritima TaxID=126957 RepID=T1JA43_STRMM
MQMIEYKYHSLNEDLLIGASTAHPKHSQLYSVIEFGSNVLLKGVFFHLHQLLQHVRVKTSFGGKDILVGLIARDKPQMGASKVLDLFVALTGRKIQGSEENTSENITVDLI